VVEWWWMWMERPPRHTEGSVDDLALDAPIPDALVARLRAFAATDQGAA